MRQLKARHDCMAACRYTTCCQLVCMYSAKGLWGRTSQRVQAQALPVRCGSFLSWAVVHVLPPSDDTSTRTMSLPPPLHAYPRTAWTQCGTQHGVIQYNAAQNTTIQCTVWSSTPLRHVVMSCTPQGRIAEACTWQHCCPAQRFQGYTREMSSL
jgi:hypothetical protein